MIETCLHCLLKQFVPVNGKCRRCNASLGVAIVEVKLPSGPASENSPRGCGLPLGDAIRSLRRKQHRTQSELASAAGLGRSILSRVECSAAAPNSNTLVRILRGLRVESLWLVCRTQIAGKK